MKLIFPPLLFLMSSPVWLMPLLLSEVQSATWTEADSTDQYWTVIAASSSGQYLAGGTDGYGVLISSDYGSVWTVRVLRTGWGLEIDFHEQLWSVSCRSELLWV